MKTKHNPLKIYLLLLLTPYLYSNVPPYPQLNEPISSLSTALGNVLFPAGFIDYNYSAMSYEMFIDENKLSKDYNLAFTGAGTGFAIVSQNKVNNYFFSLALPIERGFSLGYTLERSDDSYHSIGATLRPFHTLSTAFQYNQIASKKSWVNAAFSFRPLSETFTLSYQWGANLKGKNTHSIYGMLNLKQKFHTWVKYDFNDLTVGFALANKHFSIANTLSYLNKFKPKSYTFEYYGKQEREPYKTKFNPTKFINKKLLAITLSGDVSTPKGNFNNDNYSPSAYEFSEIAKRIIKNRNIDGLFITFENLSCGYGTAQIIRKTLADLKAHKKRIIAYATSYSQLEYFIATAADEIFVGKMGEIDLKGFGEDGLYLKRFLDKYGIYVDVLQAGNYKSAGESVSRTNMSSYAKEEQISLISNYSTMVFDEIIKSRGLHTTTEYLLSEGSYSSHDAKKFNLIDGIYYRDSLVEKLNRDGYTTSSLSVLYAEKINKWEGVFDRNIAIIEINGAIQEGNSTQNFLTGQVSCGANTVIKNLEEAARNSTTKAILLYINSPGGSVLASDLVWSAVTKIATREGRPLPVIAAFGDVAASGGYYIGVAASKIYVMPAAITGSIGVIYQKPSIEDLLTKLGVTFDGAGIGENRSINSILKKMSSKQREKIQRDIYLTYTNFVEIVYQGRKENAAISKEKLFEIAGGRVWTGEDALKLGLADMSGSIGDAIDFMRAKYNIDPDYGYVKLYETYGFSRGLLGNAFLMQAAGRAWGVARLIPNHKIKSFENKMFAIYKQKSGVFHTPSEKLQMEFFQTLHGAIKESELQGYYYDGFVPK